MLFKKIVLATAGVFFCCSLVSAQDFSYLQNETDYFTAANTKSRASVVSSLPSDVLSQPELTASTESNAEEVSAAHQADFLVLLGLGGFTLAGMSLAGICLVLHKRSTSVKKPVTLVGV